jgi:hypothetical protein
MMRKASWIIPVLLSLAVGATSARADETTDGTFVFSLTSGSAPTAGSFVYDNTTSEFTSFSITWDGLTYTPSIPIGNDEAVFDNLPTSPTDAETWCGAGPTSSGQSCIPVESVYGAVGGLQPGFYLFIPNGVEFFAIGQPATTNMDDAYATGTYTVTETTVTPEPASMVLFGTGLVGIGFMMHKRSFA